MIRVTVAPGREIMLPQGAHNDLIKDILDSFAPRFVPAAEVIHLGETCGKVEFCEEQRLAQLGVTVDRRGKMPDLVLYLEKMDWLLLIESVTSHGPVDAKRHNELAKLFSEAGPVSSTSQPFQIAE